MIYLVYLLIFVAGSAIGSFLNVLISRSIAGKDWVSGRSRCDYCQKNLAWFDMIPLFSYLAYRGRSRCCNKALSLQHPMVESLTGMLFLWWAMMGNYFFHLVTQPLTYIQPSFWLILGVILTVIAVTDYYYGLVPVIAVYVGLAITVIYRLLLISFGEYQIKDLGISVISMLGAGIFIYLLRLITHKRGMGEGDIFIASLSGLLLSYPRILVSLWASFVGGAVVGILLIIKKRKHLKSSIPFGPFLVGGTVISLIWGKQLIEWWIN